MKPLLSILIFAMALMYSVFSQADQQAKFSDSLDKLPLGSSIVFSIDDIVEAGDRTVPGNFEKIFEVDNKWTGYGSESCRQQISFEFASAQTRRHINGDIKFTTSSLSEHWPRMLYPSGNLEQQGVIRGRATLNGKPIAISKMYYDSGYMTGGAGGGFHLCDGSFFAQDLRDILAKAGGELHTPHPINL